MTASTKISTQSDHGY